MAITSAPTRRVSDDAMTHLHLHTEHSFLDGVPTVNQLVDRILELGQDSVAITDHGEVSGHLRLQKAADKAGVKPIFGCEGYFCDDRRVKEGRKGELYDHITLIAQTTEGLHNLWALISRSYLEGLWYGDPRCDWELLREYSPGLIATGGCLSGSVAKYLNPENKFYNPDRAAERLSRFIEIFGDRFFLELHTFDNEHQAQVNNDLVQLATDSGVGLIAVSDSHYLRPDDWEDHELLTAIQMGKTYDDPTRYQYGPNQLCVFGAQEVYDRLSYLGDSVVSEAMTNTREIAKSCGAVIKRELSMPVFFDSPDMDRIKMRELAEQGFQRKVAAYHDEQRQQVYRERLEYELSVIEPKGFPGYFLKVRDIMVWAKKQGILCSIRGSVGGCLLAYLLDITEVDPVRHDLIFERFLDPGRNTLPDIDMDFPQSARPRVRRYLEEEYGPTSVATIGALSTLGPRQLMKDLCRGLKIPFLEAAAMNKIIEQMPDLNVAHIDTSWPLIEQAFAKELAPWKQKYPRLFELMVKFDKHIRNSGVHAAGLVIADRGETLLGQIPLRYAPKTDEIRTQVTWEEVEELGYPKMDVLGLRTLDTLDVCWNLVQERHPELGLAKYDDWQYEFEKYYEDDEVYHSLWDGKNIGIFQLESAGFRDLAKRFKPRTLYEVCDLVSLFRPGITRTFDPETGMNLLDLYIERRDGLRQPRYKHPLLEGIIGPTHGNFLYQEQLMRTCEVLAGYSLAETDRVRKILGKKEVDKMVKERVTFVEGCMRTHGMSQELAHSIFDEMEEFGKYGFNRAHGLAYAIVATQCAYMKHHFPREFMTALFITNEDGAPLYSRECQRMGIPLLGPDINESGHTFTLTPGGVIRYGLSKIKFVANAAELIQGAQPFTSVSDFVERCPKKVTKRAVVPIICVGAMDSLVDVGDMKEYPDWYTKSQVAYHQWLMARGGKDAKGLDDECEKTPRCSGHSVFEHLCQDLKITDLAATEKEYLGSIISVDPLGPYIQLINSEETFQSEAAMVTGESARLGGVISWVNPTTTKKGKNAGALMCQLRVDLPVRPSDEEESGVSQESVQVVCWPEDYEKHGPKIEVGAPVLCDVKKLAGGGVCLSTLFRLDEL